MSDLEQHFIQASQRLRAAAQQFAGLKIQVIRSYLEKQYPGVKFEIKTEENILSTDLVFPGMRRARSYQLSREINDYLQGLLERENEGINER